MAKDKGKIKNPNAVALGHLGGKVGGLQRAKKLGKGRRTQIARLGGEARAAQMKREKNKGDKK